MSLLLLGVDMPTFAESVTIYKDGRVVSYDTYRGGTIIGTAVPVPTPHGRLVDLDSKTFPTPHRNPSNGYMMGWNTCLKSVNQQPVIIDKEENG